MKKSTIFVQNCFISEKKVLLSTSSQMFSTIDHPIFINFQGIHLDPCPAVPSYAQLCPVVPSPENRSPKRSWARMPRWSVSKLRSHPSLGAGGSGWPWDPGMVLCEAERNATAEVKVPGLSLQSMLVQQVQQALSKLSSILGQSLLSQHFLKEKALTERC